MSYSKDELTFSSWEEMLKWQTVRWRLTPGLNPVIYVMILCNVQVSPRISKCSVVSALYHKLLTPSPPGRRCATPLLVKIRRHRSLIPPRQFLWWTEQTPSSLSSHPLCCETKPAYFLTSTCFSWFFLPLHIENWLYIHIDIHSGFILFFILFSLTFINLLICALSLDQRGRFWCHSKSAPPAP